MPAQIPPSPLVGEGDVAPSEASEVISIRSSRARRPPHPNPLPGGEGARKGRSRLVRTGVKKGRAVRGGGRKRETGGRRERGGYCLHRPTVPPESRLDRPRRPDGSIPDRVGPGNGPPGAVRGGRGANQARPDGGDGRPSMGGPPEPRGSPSALDRHEKARERRRASRGVRRLRRLPPACPPQHSSRRARRRRDGFGATPGVRGLGRTLGVGLAPQASPRLPPRLARRGTRVGRVDLAGRGGGPRRASGRHRRLERRSWPHLACSREDARI